MSEVIAEKPRDTAIWRDWLAAISKPGIGALIALTIVGGVLRFVRLAHPPLLYDEAATYTRVTGSFAEMVNTLRFDGFPPLHYEVYWLMSRFVRMTPVMMRVVPAICGTLMIPAIYFLARQVASRRVATLAAAITCFSAWMLVYSRDAKMYMELWLFATLFVAALLWWLRDGWRVAWLAWVASGCAMNALHALGLCAVGVAVVIVLTHPALTRRKLALAAAGLLLTTIGLAGYYAFSNRFGQTVATQGWHSSGLEWIEQRNEKLSGKFGKSFLVWDTAASWVLAYRAPRPPIDPPNRVIAPVAIVSAILGALFLTAMWRWPRPMRDDDPDDAPPARTGLWIGAWLILPMVGFALVSAVTKHDLWNARYLAIVWPAAAVLMALAILRLPLPWLRAGAIGLLLGANLLQFGLRISVESGAAVDQIAHDLAAAKKSAGKTLTAVIPNARLGDLGNAGGIFDFPGKYYLAIEMHAHLRPKQLRDESIRKHFDIPADVASIPATVERLIVWTDGGKLDEDADPILKQLGPAWIRASAQEHAVRDFWCWRRMFRCTRSTYTRGEASDSTDSTPPAAPRLPGKKKPKRK